MPYTTLQQLIDRFGEVTLVQLTDRGPEPTGAIGVDTVERALADTDAEIDGWLTKRYRMPLAETPRLVADIAQVIAIYKLHVFAPDPKIEKDYELALKSLRQLATGEKVLVGAAGLEPATSGAGGVVASDRGRDLTPDNLHGFI